ncbi:MAG: ATP-binding protein [Candidatus Marinimicrobia bacterium]|nr:ATP-binding protein [Candidatus Neomarinimicrobiota bacterium]MDP6577570.1 ATP-binding protein [Candidatus Neomarinimicrobiota bacterium]MDP7060893.1 ATP-binding protein [Candidatus Neomarinimicrobiota bacterium]
MSKLPSMAIELSLQLTNNRPEIRNLRNRFDIFAQDNELPDKVIHDVQLALDEVVTNIVEYGYDDDDKHLIDIKFILNEQSLEIIIIDDANPYNILDKENPETALALEDKPIGGLGIYLVKHLMTNIDYDYRDGKNHLSLSKSLTEGDIN